MMVATMTTLGVFLLANALYVGTDVSEKANRSRFYDAAGDEVGARVESVNDLPGSIGLVNEPLLRAKRIDAKEILWGLVDIA